jgi:hypothetical protein
MDEPDILRYGVLPLVCLILYAVIDKVVVPLVNEWRHGWRHAESGGSDGGNGNGTLATEYRMARLEQDVHELRVAVDEARRATDAEVREIRISAQVSQSILKRLERRFDDS